MGAMLNGLAAHGGLIPFGATFLIFSDYMRPSMRLAALSRLHVVYVFTHDSIALGEDGPTHQPVEQLLSLRAIPNMVVIRPADANETAASWRVAIEHRDGPVALVLSRQSLPVLGLDTYPQLDSGVRAGGYVLARENGDAPPDIILIASGSEVSLALDVHKKLGAEGVRSRVVSLPSWNLFDKQPGEYREAVLPPRVPMLAIEAGTPLGWRSYTGEGPEVVGVTHFGASAPEKVLMEKYGFDVDQVTRKALVLIRQPENAERG